MRNKKGFTLVELLAVIVILALIMGIAVVSVGSVINRSKSQAFQETAASLLNGVRQRLYIENESGAGYYTLKSTILEKGGITSAYGGNIKYATGTCTAVGDDLCKSSTALSCSASATTFVHVDNNGGYTICVVDDKGYFVEGTETELLGLKATITTPAP